MSRTAQACTGFLTWVISASSATTTWGLIDPRFTPVQVVHGAARIVTGNLSAGSAEDWRIEPVEVLKGEPAQAKAPVVLDLAGADPDQREDLRNLLTGRKDCPAILFAAESAEDSRAWAHVADQWLEVVPGRSASRWAVRRQQPKMSAVFAGGTDMLIRMTRYILVDPGASVPIEARVGWLQARPCLGRFKGVSGLQALCFEDGAAYLFIASADGDRLFRARPNDEAFDDVTATTGLDTRSRRCAWLDLDGDGRADLASWDGRALTARRVSDRTAFERLGADLPLAEDVLALVPCTLPDGTPALVASTADMPVVLSRDRGGQWRRQGLPGGAAVSAAGQALMACVVADLDNDGYWDVLQPRSRGGVLWKGGPEGLDGPVASAVTNADAGAHSALGDFDQDGLLDLFIGGAKSIGLWENHGRGEFRQVTRAAGSLAYRGEPGLSACCATDLNHDGRTDLCLLYPKGEMAYHFNRGFRCFGEEGRVTLDPGDTQSPAAGIPQSGTRPAPGRSGSVPPGSACAVADFNQDGSLDLAVALADGEVRCFYNAAYARPMVSLGLKNTGGPITASVWQGEPAQCLGAASLTGPQPTAVLPLREDAPAVVRWRASGRQAQTRAARSDTMLLDP
jgi:hypothetical protein